MPLGACPFLAHVVQNRNLHNDDGESGVFRSARHLSAGSLSQWGYISLSAKEVFGFTLIPNDTAYGVGQDFAEGFSIKHNQNNGKAGREREGFAKKEQACHYGDDKAGGTSRARQHIGIFANGDLPKESKSRHRKPR